MQEYLGNCIRRDGPCGRVVWKGLAGECACGDTQKNITRPTPPALRGTGACTAPPCSLRPHARGGLCAQPPQALAGWRRCVTPRGPWSDAGEAAPSPLVLRSLRGTARRWCSMTGGVRTHFARLALTRAKARALRDALNIGICAVEKLE